MRCLLRHTPSNTWSRAVHARCWLALAVFGLAPAGAAVLPEDRADMMYHYYDGGGVTVQGPALLVRKGVGDSVSLSGRYYLDTISSASIDVITTASPYKDEREEYGVSVDYLRGNSLMSLSYTTSKENDYLADTYGFNVSHDFFGGLTTVSIGYGQGRDVVQRVDTAFEDEIDRFQFRLGVTQVLTRRLLVGLGYEGVSEDGYLSNPYRSVRVGASFPGATQFEEYPRTRDSRAVAVRAVMGFGSELRPLVRSIRAEYRYFNDTWDIGAHTVSLALQRYFGERWIGELRYRYYQQSAASFYSDLFPATSFRYTYMARDKELSTFSSHSIGIKASWLFVKRPRFRGAIIGSYDYLSFNYDDFTDVRNGQLYSFNADVAQLSISLWY